MPSTGYIRIRAYQSRAELPLKDVAVAITATDGTAISLQLTDRSGLTQPVAVPVPDLEASQTPDTGEIPFTTINIYARLKGYEQIENEDVQIFPDVVTTQDLEMIPLSEMPGEYDKRELFITPAQNL